MKVLSIDAWNNNDGWEWNAWYNLDEISTEDFATLETDDDVLNWFRDNDYILNIDTYYINDDESNIVILRKEDDKPLYAIAYGEEL